MLDYRLEAKIKNNRIMERIEKAGYSSISSFCRAINMDPGTVGRFLNLREGLYTRHGIVKKSIQKIADFLGCAPEDLFSDTQINMELKTNKTFKLISDAEMLFTLENKSENDPIKLLEKLDLNNVLEESLTTLTPREMKVLKGRFGLEEESKTLDEMAGLLNVSRERIRQIEAKALRKMRHPMRSDPLVDFIDIKKEK